MRRIFLYLLILQFCTGNLLGSEVIKIPFLVYHYRLHHESRPQDTWVDFLRLHYANTKHRGMDPRHRQLPLYSGSSLSPTVMLLPATLESFMPDAERLTDPALPFHDETLLPADFRARLLRPPQG